MSMMLQTEPRIRAALLALAEDGCRHELIDGEHIVTPAPAPLHQVILARRYDALRPRVAAHQLEVWRPTSETGHGWRNRLVWPVPAEAPLAIDHLIFGPEA